MSSLAGSFSWLPRHQRCDDGGGGFHREETNGLLLGADKSWEKGDFMAIESSWIYP
jgi:hypothetical protein